MNNQDKNESTVQGRVENSRFKPQWAFSMEETLKKAKELGHEKFAARDHNTSSGSKSWASFPCKRELFEYIERLPNADRCVYELITSESRVCMWFDIEFLSDQQQDGEVKRLILESCLKEAIAHSFAVTEPIMMWGTSTRFDTKKKMFKHSYQLRVPSLIFENNLLDGALARWVKRFVQSTSNMKELFCDVTKKHIVDTLVYSRVRCVRTYMSMKANDITCTPLKFLPELGSGGLIAGHGKYAEFCALSVEPSLDYDALHISPLKIANSDVVPFVLPSYNADIPNIMKPAETLQNVTKKKKRKADAMDGSNDGLDELRAITSQTYNYTSNVIECLAQLGSKAGENYEDWSLVMFAVRNKSEGASALQAFLEWSKRASSFTSDTEVEKAFLAFDARQEGSELPTLGLPYLQKTVRNNRYIVYNEEKTQKENTAQDNLSEALDLYSFLQNINMRKSCWRTVVRTTKLIWPDRREDVLEHIATFADEYNCPTLKRGEIAKVWDYEACKCKFFTDCVIANVKRDLFWPTLIMHTLPSLLSQSLEANVEIQSYSCDEISTLNVQATVKSKDSIVTNPPLSRKFIVNLKDGMVKGTKICLLRNMSFMFDKRDPTRLNSEFTMEAQVNWAKKISQIPSLQKNLRCVQGGVWCIYNEETGIWTEYDSKSPLLKIFLSDEVKRHFLPYYNFLDFKSSFDVVSDEQRKLLEKIFSKFSNNEFLEKMLDALEGCKDVLIDDFHKVFNANPHVIPCKNGLLDFRTLTIKPLERVDFCTFKIPIMWDPDADTTAPSTFIKSLFPYNTEDIFNFVTCWLGYCMTGMTFMQICTFMIGYGSNGKSKLTQIMEQILGPVAFAKVSYEALCQKCDRPNEELYEARNARMWQIDENSDDTVLNFVMIKKISGEDGMHVRRLYGHQVKVPPRAKLNFAVNKNPKLPSSNTVKEQSSLSRRFVYLDCPMQFVDFTENGKDAKKIEAFRQEFTTEHFNKCVAQVDLNMDAKLKTMLGGFFRLFVEAIHRQYVKVGEDSWDMKPIPIPRCLQQQNERMMRSNPALKADEFLNSQYEPGVIGEVRILEAYKSFLCFYQLDDNNFGLSRFEQDLEKWVANQNNSHPNCKQNNLIVRKLRYSRGKFAGQSYCKNMAKVSDYLMQE